MLTVIVPKREQVKIQKAPAHLLAWDQRWVGEHNYETSDLLLDKHTLRNILARRNVVYRRWMKYWGIPNRRIQWQEIVITNEKHSHHSTTKDFFFLRFIEGKFTVFINPISFADKQTGKVYQYYLLSPEDGYEVSLQLHRDKGIFIPRRRIEGDELFMPKDMELSVPRVVPVEMCRQIRHFTTAGVIDAPKKEGQYQEQNQEKEKKIIIAPK